jgi:hypothetical protein
MQHSSSRLPLLGLGLLGLFGVSVLVRGYGDTTMAMLVSSLVMFAACLSQRTRTCSACAPRCCFAAIADRARLVRRTDGLLLRLVFRQLRLHRRAGSARG